MTPWFQIGPFGLALLGVGAVGAWWIKRELANEPVGHHKDPLGPREEPPDTKLFSYPVETELDLPRAAAAWERAWAARYGERLTSAQANVLLAHTVLASGRKGEVVSHNLVRKTTHRFDPHRWTVVRRVEWKGPRPVYRWVPIRAYLSDKAGADDWLATLGERATVAVRAANPGAYVRALGLPPKIAAEYAPELTAEWKRLQAA